MVRVLRAAAMAVACTICLPFASAHAQRSARPGGPAGRGTPTSAEAARFIARAEAELAAAGVALSRAQWVSENFITDDTEQLAAEANRVYAVAVQRLAIGARRYDRVRLDPTLRRKLGLLVLALTAPPPADSAKAAELARIGSSLSADYGKGRYCRPAKPGSDAARAGEAKECLQINDASRILAESHDPAELLDVWRGWHAVGAPLRDRYARHVALSNEGARQLGFPDLGAMWRANYDMPPDAFAAEVERLWQQVRPLYLSLHAYVRGRLAERYGAQVVPADGPIPAHLLGNMWAQEWGNIYPMVAPKDAAGTGYDLTELLRKKGLDQREMVRYGERFFTSLGQAPLPETFWQRSLIVKPRDRDVVCHASAWDIDSKEDVRIKMCTEVTGEDFVTVHHELGHNFYQRAYREQPPLFQGGANDGFHEAIGDAIALSITPEYLKTVGLLEQLPSEAADTALLLRQALDKVAFLPFGLVIDQWRWKVFSGEIAPADYNRSWWALRERYQGVAPPVARSEADFDPGAKYHVPANVPYTRYFLARVLQFQFYRALCREAGYTGPLHRCSFYGSKAAGQKLDAMLAMGQSRPWPDVLYAMTGERRMDAGALLDYFAPLKVWLDRQNQGRTLGWKGADGTVGLRR
jgi:peptidyl-dipeptidase A